MIEDRKHIVVVGGGTGGHLFPGIAVVESVLEIDPSVRVSFVGAERGIEARKIPELGYELHLLDVQPLKSGGAKGFAVGLGRLPSLAVSCLSLVRRLRPTLVIAVGGYSAGPFSAVAAMSGVPMVLLEQNVEPGMTNKILSRLAKIAFVSFEETALYFPGTTSVCAGNPIRDEISTLAESFVYEPSRNASPFRVLVVGGSGGASSFNEHLPGALTDAYSGSRPLQITHQAGKREGHVSATRERYGARLSEDQVTVLEFIDSMTDAYSQCDLIICRCGMGTIAEITALGIPAIYIPFPGAGGHQRMNAEAVVGHGGGWLIDDSQIHQVGAQVKDLTEDADMLRASSVASRSFGRPDAALRIAQSCVELIGERSEP
jgi:UDP-N-acetylglucosamine--N-acetylmuramyl-(pentapeptide) pyrophosphoryl-undecaprenol N-acetylglucosamine transferase